jgi:hypothetical protein
MVDGVGASEFHFFITLHRDMHQQQAAFLQAMAHEMAVHVVPHVTMPVGAARVPGLMMTSLISDAMTIREPTKITDLQRRTAVAIAVRDRLLRLGHAEIAERFFERAIEDLARTL